MANYVSHIIELAGDASAYRRVLHMCDEQNSKRGEGYATVERHRDGAILVTHYDRYAERWDIAYDISLLVANTAVELAFFEPMFAIMGTASFRNGHLIEYSSRYDKSRTEWSADSGIWREYELAYDDEEDPFGAYTERLTAEEHRFEHDVFRSISPQDLVEEAVSALRRGEPVSREETIDLADTLADAISDHAAPYVLEPIDLDENSQRTVRTMVARVSWRHCPDRSETVDTCAVTLGLASSKRCEACRNQGATRPPNPDEVLADMIREFDTHTAKLTWDPYDDLGGCLEVKLDGLSREAGAKPGNAPKRAVAVSLELDREGFVQFHVMHRPRRPRYGRATSVEALSTELNVSPATVLSAIRSAFTHEIETYVRAFDRCAFSELDSGRPSASGSADNADAIATVAIVRGGGHHA